MRCLPTGLFFLLLGASAWSAARPEWTRLPPREDALHKYYVGRAAEASSEAQAFSEATRDAYEQAIRENFGLKTRIEAQSHEELGESHHTKYREERSREVQVYDFEQREFFVERDRGGALHAWVLYRYRKAAIEAEKQRLARTEEERKAVFSELGSVADSAQGTLEVETVPPGASLYVDEVPVNFVTTPLRLVGKLPLGKHRVRIDHPSFATIEEDVLITPGAKVRLLRRLAPAFGSLSLDTDPTGASLIINGRPHGMTPIMDLRLKAGEVHRIEILHPEAQRLMQEITLEKNEALALELPLVKKPAKLTVTSLPANTQVIWQGKSIGHTPLLGLSLPAGEGNLVLKKEGYEPWEHEVQLRGGEHHQIANVALKPGGWEEDSSSGESEDEEVDDSPGLFARVGLWLENTSAERQMEGYPWLLGLWFGVSGTPLKEATLTTFHAALSLEKNFWGIFGLQAALSYHYGFGGDVVYSNDNDYTYELEGAELSLSVPLYLTKTIFVAPEMGFTHTSYSRAFELGYWASTRKQQLNQRFRGGVIGLHWYWQRNNEHYGFQIKAGGRQYQGSRGHAGTRAIFFSMGILLGL